MEKREEKSFTWEMTALADFNCIIRSKFTRVRFVRRILSRHGLHARDFETFTFNTIHTWKTTVDKKKCNEALSGVGKETKRNHDRYILSSSDFGI